MGFANDYFCDDVSVEEKFKYPFGGKISEFVFPSNERINNDSLRSSALHVYSTFMNRGINCIKAEVRFLNPLYGERVHWKRSAIVMLYQYRLHELEIRMFTDFHYELIQTYNQEIIKSQPFMYTTDLIDYIIRIVKLININLIKKSYLYKGAKYE